MKNNVSARLFLLFICLVTGTIAANAQIITTYAGGDTSGYSGDNGPATAGRMRNPVAVITDTGGNIYFSESANNCIRKVSKSGTITTIAGNPGSGYTGDGGPATAATLNNPQTMGIDDIGNIYIADWGNNVIRKIDTFHVIRTVVGTGVHDFGGDGGPATGATLDGPRIAVDHSGNIYISDHNNHRIRKVNAAGVISTIAGTGNAGYTGNGGQALAANMNPYNLAVDPQGNIYFVDEVSSVYRVIRRIDAASGTITEYLNIWAQSLLFDDLGNLYFSDIGCFIRRARPEFNYQRIYAGNSTCVTSGDSSTATSAGMNLPSGMALDAAMNLYVAETGGSRIRKITYDPSGINDIHGNTGKVNIYPNPASADFTIDIPAIRGEVAISVSDMAGRVIATKQVQAGSDGISERFDTRSLSPGIYLVKVSSGNDIYREKVSVK